MGASGLSGDLERVDRLLDRWGSYDRHGEPKPLHPLEAIRMLHDGAVLGGGSGQEPEWIEVVDSIVIAAPRDVNALLKVWYATGTPVSVKAQRLGISRAAIYVHWKGALRYVQGALGPRLYEFA